MGIQENCKNYKDVDYLEIIEMVNENIEIVDKHINGIYDRLVIYHYIEGI